MEKVHGLEGLAAHRGSVLGHLPERPQPSQKRFESALWDTLRRHDPARLTYVESESRKVGQCQIPEALIAAIRASGEGTLLRAPDAVRCDLLLEAYRHFTESPERLLARLPALIAHHGQERVAEWSALVQQARWRELVASLLAHHYDPAYQRSMQRNFSCLSAFGDLELTAATGQAITALAERLLGPSTAA